MQRAYIMVVLILAATLGLTACETMASAPIPPGVYGAVAGEERLHIRVATEGRVDFYNPHDGQLTRTKPLVVSSSGMTGMLPSGEVYSIDAGRTQLSVGTRLFRLTPMPAAQFGAPAPAAVRAAPGHGVSTALAGLRLTSASSRNGYGDMRTFDFCSNGNFLYRFEELQSSQFGNAAAARTDRGTWAVAGSTLRLRYNASGATAHAIVRIADDVIALDGRRYAIERSERCR